jgi:hypothetical protein
MTKIAALCLALGLAAALSALAIPAQPATAQAAPAAPAPAAFQLPAEGGLPALPAAGGLATCRYVCRNTSTGQITVRSTTTSEGACCSGDGLSCPAGTVFAGPISWNNLFIEGC